MKVTITAIQDDEAVLVKGTSALGHRGKFGCPLVTGEAVFIPARGFERNLRVGNVISVETAHESVSNFRVVDEQSDMMQALDQAGDYAVRGRITLQAPQGRITVAVRGFTFRLDRSELNGQTLSIGQYVQFNLHGLALWDENLPTS